MSKMFKSFYWSLFSRPPPDTGTAETFNLLLERNREREIRKGIGKRRNRRNRKGNMMKGIGRRIGGEK